MRLFVKEHLSIILFYLISILGLPLLIESLDGFANHYVYFCFLSIVLLLCLLLIRYLRRRKMYANLEKSTINKESLAIYEPRSPIEKAYSNQLKAVSTLFLEEEEHYQQFSQEQELLITHAVHQMKIPVSVIQLLVQSNQGKSNDTLAWQKVKTECDKLTFSLNQLLTYSRSNQLISDLKIEAISLKKMVQEVVNDLKDYFIEQEMFPKVTIPDEILLYSDRKWMKVVIYQVVSNAIKYGDTGTTIIIDYENGNLSIRNEGETIPESDIHRIFDLFYTGSKGRVRGEATGIGLYLVKKILDTLKHPFTLESSQNQTVFTVDLSQSVKVVNES